MIFLTIFLIVGLVTYYKVRPPKDAQGNKTQDGGPTAGIVISSIVISIILTTIIHFLTKPECPPPPKLEDWQIPYISKADVKEYAKYKALSKRIRDKVGNVRKLMSNDPRVDGECALRAALAIINEGKKIDTRPYAAVECKKIGQDNVIYPMKNEEILREMSDINLCDDHSNRAVAKTQTRETGERLGGLGLRDAAVGGHRVHFADNVGAGRENRGVGEGDLRSILARARDTANEPQGGGGGAQGGGGQYQGGGGAQGNRQQGVGVGPQGGQAPAPQPPAPAPRPPAPPAPAPPAPRPPAPPAPAPPAPAPAPAPPAPAPAPAPPAPAPRPPAPPAPAPPAPAPAPAPRPPAPPAPAPPAPAPAPAPRPPAPPAPPAPPVPVPQPPAPVQPPAPEPALVPRPLGPALVPRPQAPVQPQGVQPQGVQPQGVQPQGVQPQGTPLKPISQTSRVTPSEILFDSDSEPDVPPFLRVPSRIPPSSKKQSCRRAYQSHWRTC